MAQPNRSNAAPLLRDQRWALHAYNVVAAVPKDEQKDYKIAINDVGANILRSGLSAAMAVLERIKGHRVCSHIADARVTGLDPDGLNLPANIRALDADAYMLATREILQVVTWLKRATQATFRDE